MVIVSFKTQLGQDFLCLDNNDQIKASTPLSLLTKCDCALCQVSCWLLVVLIMHFDNEMINQDIQIGTKLFYWTILKSLHFSQWPSEDLGLERDACLRSLLPSLFMHCLLICWQAGRLAVWPATNGDFMCHLSIVAPKRVHSTSVHSTGSL